MRIGTKTARTVAVVAIMLLVGGLASAQFGGGDGAGLGGGGRGGRAAATKTPSRLDAIARVIQSTIQPDTWDQVGGSGTLQALDDMGVFVISQTTQVHEDIENLMTTLRKARLLQGGGEIPESKPISLSVGSDANRQAEERIQARLGAEAEFNFDETPLIDVVGFVAQEFEIPVYVDTRALDDNGLGSDTSVTQHLKGISLRSALRITLRELDLTYAIREGTLTITTRDDAESSLLTRIYLIDDFASR